MKSEDRMFSAEDWRRIIANMEQNNALYSRLVKQSSQQNEEAARVDEQQNCAEGWDL